MALDGIRLEGAVGDQGRAQVAEAVLDLRRHVLEQPILEVDGRLIGRQQRDIVGRREDIVLQGDLDELAAGNVLGRDRRIHEMVAEEEAASTRG